MIKNIKTKDAIEELRKKLSLSKDVFFVELLPNDGPKLTEEYVNESNEKYKTLVKLPCCRILN